MTAADTTTRSIGAALDEQAGGPGVRTECDAALVRAIELLGKRWNALILDVLRGGPRGFASVRRAVGPITDSMLADRLLELTAAGVVERTETGERPARITYGLTPRGSALMPALEQLARWAADNLDCTTAMSGPSSR